jgi:hypothetical protein
MFMIMSCKNGAALTYIVNMFNYNIYIYIYNVNILTVVFDCIYRYLSSYQHKGMSHVEVRTFVILLSSSREMHG